MAAWLSMRFHLTAKWVEHQKLDTKSSKSPRLRGASLQFLDTHLQAHRFAFHACPRLICSVLKFEGSHDSSKRADTKHL